MRGWVRASRVISKKSGCGLWFGLLRLSACFIAIRAYEASRERCSTLWKCAYAMLVMSAFLVVYSSRLNKRYPLTQQPATTVSYSDVLMRCCAGDCSPTGCGTARYYTIRSTLLLVHYTAISSTIQYSAEVHKWIVWRQSTRRASNPHRSAHNHHRPTLHHSEVYCGAPHSTCTLCMLCARGCTSDSLRSTSVHESLAGD